MSVRLKPVRDQVIVITGASSGIGLATAQMAADRGARVVLAARNAAALADVQRRLGDRALAVPTDVSLRADVERLADAAVRRFGGFDTWVNDAGVSIYGRLEEVSEEDHRRLFDVNFWGLVHGSFVAAAHLRRRGGALVNVGSVAGDLSFPLQGMYCASKHAVRGFTDALRLELEADHAPISVTLVKPTGVNTPFTHHARNYMAVEPKVPDPAYQPEDVARAILHAAEYPERDLYIGGAARAMTLLAPHSPRTTDRIEERVMFAQQRTDQPARNPEGNLYRPSSGGQARGDHPGWVRGVSLYTRARTHPRLAGALLAAAAGAAAMAIARTKPLAGVR
jgi:NADP-dependent 3-hydroxy acid dehydrogenase YdfG